MARNSIGLREIENAIKALSTEEQKKLLAHLPNLIKIQEEDKSLLKVAEKAFDFWNNPEDEIYDSL